MSFPSRQRALPWAIVLGLAAILIVLAVLQYRWSGEVSEAASERMRSNLQTSMMSFRQDLYRELSGVCSSFQVEGANARDVRDQYAARYEAWSRSTTHAGMIANFFLVEATKDESPRLLRLNSATEEFEAQNWPETFEVLRKHITTASVVLTALPPRFATGKGREGYIVTRNGQGNVIFQEGGPRFLFGRPPDGPPVPRENQTRRDKQWEKERPRQRYRVFGGPPCFFNEEIPAITRPVLSNDDRPRKSVDWIVIQLSPSFLKERLLPELVKRYFEGTSGLEYHVAIVGGKDRSNVIYSSDAETQKGIGTPDATLNLWGPPGAPPVRGVFFGEAGQQTAGASVLGGIPLLVPVRHFGEEGDWQLVAKHRMGSLEAAVSGMRRRSLGFSFGVLLVLASTMAMIVIASQRAHRLANLQMDFVTGVSHELRTPLAVISSAADNIADGVIDSKEQLQRYGKAIKKQSRQLNYLVEQILLFATARQGRLRVSMNPVDVPKLINTAVNNTAELVDGAGFAVERDIESNLPPVMGDAAALAHCLQNLITNAIKYGGEEHWIGIRAWMKEEDGRGKHVLISVEDKGMGIEQSELKQIFEPFYRSREVTEVQIHGTGLGLPLAQGIAESMGGRITVTSERGKGSTFTLHLPVADTITRDLDKAASVSASFSTGQQG